MPEPSVDETIEILRGLRERYEIHHKLRYTDDSLIAAAKLSYQYIRYVNYEIESITLAGHANITIQLTK